MGLRRGATLSSSVHLDAMRSELEPLTTGVQRHELYSAVEDRTDLVTFMETHVFAVWDFMNLVKGIQQRFASSDLPWTPRGDSTIRRFVNEIVLEEESDEHPDGESFCSHFELYLMAMEEVGADTGEIRGFVASLEDGTGVPEAAKVAGTRSPTVGDFLATTWELASSPFDEELVAGFAMGRETLIPSMFERLLERGTSLEGAELLKEYLVRHVVLDGEQHSVMALELLVEVCGDEPDRWRRATVAAQRCLRARRQLWDTILAAIVGVSG